MNDPAIVSNALLLLHITVFISSYCFGRKPQSALPLEVHDVKYDRAS